MIKPYRSLLLLVYVGVLLAVALFFLPAEIPLPNSYSLRFFTLKSLLDTEGKKYADISGLEEKFTPLTEQPQTTKNATVSETKTAFTDTLETRFRIQFPAGNDSALYQFFRHLSALPESGELVRALHYGDSQIEGDRITAFLRNKFQNRFGGCGVGLVPLTDALGNRTSIKINADDAWKRLRAYGPDFKKKAPRNYGLMGSYFNFSFTYAHKLAGDTTAKDSLAREPKFITRKRSQVAVEFSRAPGAYARDSRFENIKLLYTNHEAPITLKIQSRKD